jgi:hypothetical protein
MATKLKVVDRRPRIALLQSLRFAAGPRPR